MLNPESPYVIVSVVSPQTDDPATSGRIINFPCSPTVSFEMLEQVGSKLEWSLRGPWRDRGYTTMETLYAAEARSGDAVQRASAEANWEAWKKFHMDSQAGRRTLPFERSRLPKEVIHRQALGETDEVKALADANRTAPVTAKVRHARPEANP